MKIISFREKAMLLCMLVLIFFFISIFVRLGAKQILIKRLHWDNAITQTIFFDNKILQRIEENAKHRKVDVNWKEEYPFDDAEDVTIWQRGRAFEAKIHTLEDTKIVDWCTKWLVLYRWFVEAGREVEQKIGWNVINPAMQVAKMQDGYLTFVENNKNQDERIAAVNEFADFVKSQNAEFLYIQSPGKTNPWGDSEMKGIDYSNENADRLLEGLKAKGISVYDLRQDLYEHVGSAGWHQAFFRTDHHWKPDTALWAAGRIVEKLANDYGVDVNREHFSLNDYYDDKYEKSFLGSQGKKLTLVNTELDDFDIYYPKFKTNVYMEISEYGIRETGDFSIFYNKQEFGSGDVYNENPYAMYGYGDQPEIIVHNFANENLQDKKILIIKDSMLDTAMPFLSMGLKDLRLLDIRHFNGSVRKYVSEYKPDIVLVMYKTSYGEDVKWVGHNDKFDFR